MYMIPEGGGVRTSRVSALFLIHRSCVPLTCDCSSVFALRRKQNMTCLRMERSLRHHSVHPRLAILPGGQLDTSHTFRKADLYALSRCALHTMCAVELQADTSNKSPASTAHANQQVLSWQVQAYIVMNIQHAAVWVAIDLRSTAMNAKMQLRQAGPCLRRRGLGRRCRHR